MRSRFRPSSRSSDYQNRMCVEYARALSSATLSPPTTRLRVQPLRPLPLPGCIDVNAVLATPTRAAA